MRFLAPLLAAAIAAVPLCAKADDAAALLAKHRAFAGWAAGDASMADWTRRESQTVTHDGKTYTSTTVEIRHGALYRDIDTSDDGTASEDGFTGREFWETNLNGFVHPVLGNDARMYFDVDLIFDEAIGLIPHPAIAGHATIGQTQTVIVHVDPSQGRPMDVYVDPQTGAFKRIVIEAPAYRNTLDIERYADAGNGRKAIGTYRWNGGPPWTLASLDLHPVSIDQLRPAAPDSYWTFAGPAASIPIQYVTHTYGGNAIVLNVAIDGHPGRFLLDSGASELLVSNRFASLIGAKPLGKAGFTGTAGIVVHGSHVLLDTIAAGPDVLHHVVALDGPLEPGLDGILGYDFLAGAIVDVDLSKHTLTIHDPSGYVPALARGAYAFGVDLQGLVPQIDVALAPDVTTHTFFDTGDDFFMVVSQKVRNKGLVALDDGSPPAFAGLDGTDISTGCVRLRNIQVGPYAYEQAPLCFSNSSTFADDGGLIGLDFLRHFNWTFDYPHNQLILTPNGD